MVYSMMGAPPFLHPKPDYVIIVLPGLSMYGIAQAYVYAGFAKRLTGSKTAS